MIDKEKVLELIDVRRSSESQLWGVGCSFTYGIGVESNQLYINLIAEKLKIPVSLLAQPASSITWAADQILRSDIKKDDIVIWGLTEFCRFPYYKNNQVTHITSQSKDFSNLKLLADTDYLTYIGLQSIFQVINYCNKIGAKLLIGGFLMTEETIELLRNTKEFFLAVPHYYKFNQNHYVDLGSDGLHPGPEQHKLYCENFLEEMVKRNYL